MSTAVLDPCVGAELETDSAWPGTSPQQTRMALGLAPASLDDVMATLSRELEHSGRATCIACGDPRGVRVQLDGAGARCERCGSTLS